MANQEVNSSWAVTPQHSTITSTTSEDDSQSNNNNNNNPETQADQIESSCKSDSPDNADNSQSDKVNNTTESDSCIVRSESVIKSPCKPLFVSSSTTPVIKIVDSSLESPEKDEDSNEEKKSISTTTTSVIAQTSTQSASPQNSTSFLHAASSPTPFNPFLRTSSFSSNITSSSAFDSSDPNTDSSFIFAPPKLFTPFSSSNLFDTSANFQRPSVLKTVDSDKEGTFYCLFIFCIFDNRFYILGSSSEAISTSKNPFISLNKEDIAKIKTPSFIKSSLDNSASAFSNGSCSSNKESEDLVVTNDAKPLFTFGQNLSDRVVFDSQPATVSDLKAEINSTSENLISFSDVTNNETSLKDNSSDSIKSDDSKNEIETFFNTGLKNGDSLDGAFKRKYEVITGEEGTHWLDN